MSLFPPDVVVNPLAAVRGPLPSEFVLEVVDASYVEDVKGARRALLKMVRKQYADLPSARSAD